MAPDPKKRVPEQIVTVANDGTIYVSDNRFDKIYRLKDGKWEIWMQGEELNRPNGLLAVKKNRLMVGSTKIGALRALDTETKTFMTIADGMANTDGIVTDGKDYFVSDWSGQIFFVGADGNKEQLLDTREQKSNCADIEYVVKEKLIIVPTFLKNKLVAYRVE